MAPFNMCFGEAPSTGGAVAPPGSTAKDRAHNGTRFDKLITKVSPVARI